MSDSSETSSLKPIARTQRAFISSVVPDGMSEKPISPESTPNFCRIRLLLAMHSTQRWWICCYSLYCSGYFFRGHSSSLYVQRYEHQRKTLHRNLLILSINTLLDEYQRTHLPNKRRNHCDYNVEKISHPFLPFYSSLDPVQC